MKAAAYRPYLLTVLLVILAFNYFDRSVLSLALQDIKAELALTDTQLGLLTGIAFSLFYAVMGIPIARWADRGDRIVIISATTALWSVAVALCAAAGTFVQLMLIRVAVAVGEAGCVPPAHSLIADHFTRAERPRAVAIYLLGGPISVIVAYSVAGWMIEVYGWRATFVMLGLPGVALAALAWFTLKEPRRAVARAAISESQSRALPEPGIVDVLVTLWANVTFRHLLLCFSVVFFFALGIWQWQPAFFVRTHGLKTAELGWWFAVAVGVPGLLGTLLGGELAARLAAHNERLQLRVMALAYGSFSIISVCVYLAPTYQVAFAFLALANFGAAIANGPLFATMQTVVPARMRAMSMALVYLFANLIGMGLGPLTAGALSDAYRSWAGEESLRYALLTLSPGYLWAAWHLWRGSRTVMQDLQPNEGTAQP